MKHFLLKQILFNILNGTGKMGLAMYHAYFSKYKKYHKMEEFSSSSSSTLNMFYISNAVSRTKTTCIQQFSDVHFKRPNVVFSLWLVKIKLDKLLFFSHELRNYPEKENKIVRSFLEFRIHFSFYS